MNILAKIIEMASRISAWYNEKSCATAWKDISFCAKAADKMFVMLEFISFLSSRLLLSLWTPSQIWTSSLTFRKLVRRGWFLCIYFWIRIFSAISWKCAKTWNSPLNRKMYVMGHFYLYIYIHKII